MSSCGIRGTATLRRDLNGPPEWLTADDEIHVSTQLREDSVAMAYVSQKYRLGEWCDHQQAYHARLLDRHEGAATSELAPGPMSRARATLQVEIDLDPVPGWGHNAEDHRAWLQRTLDDAAGHYRPSVKVLRDGRPQPAVTVLTCSDPTCLCTSGRSQS